MGNYHLLLNSDDMGTLGAFKWILGTSLLGSKLS